MQYEESNNLVELWSIATPIRPLVFSINDSIADVARPTCLDNPAKLSFRDNNYDTIRKMAAIHIC